MGPKKQHSDSLDIPKSPSLTLGIHLKIKDLGPDLRHSGMAKSHSPYPKVQTPLNGSQKSSPTLIVNHPLKGWNAH